MEIVKAKVGHDFYDGVMTGDEIKRYRKTYGEIENIYQHKDSRLPAHTVMYEVFSYEGEPGSAALLWGLTVLRPIRVMDECNMTRGHYHQDRRQPEIYFGFAGQGLLLMMDEKGTVFAEEVAKGTVHYIQGKYAHRLINTGDVDFKVGACWGRIAGHDYEAIEKMPFGKRVFKINDQIIIR